MLSLVLRLKEKETEDKPDTWVRVTDNDEIQQLLRSRNEQHFHQPSEIPLKCPQTMQMVSWYSTSDTCKKILQGEKPENISEQLNSTIVTTMFEQFKIAASQMEADISFKEFKEMFAKWREPTSTSPLGRHLGHYQVLFVLNGTINKEEIGEKIMLIHYQGSQ